MIFKHFNPLPYQTKILHGVGNFYNFFASTGMLKPSHWKILGRIKIKFEKNTIYFNYENPLSFKIHIYNEQKIVKLTLGCLH